MLGEAEAGVALAQPEQHARHEEQEGVGGGERRVQLLAGVETTLRRRPAAEQPASVVAIEAVELARRPQNPAPVARERNQERAARPSRFPTRNARP